MDSENNSQLAAALAQRVGEDADVARIAEAVVATWREIDAALTPIIGQRGTATLYKRSVYLASAGHPWLASAHVAGPASMDLAALGAALARQDAVHAAAAAGALLQTFDELLASLVGPSLSERLLRPVWAHSLTGPPTQDTRP